METSVELGHNSRVVLRKTLMVYDGPESYVTMHDIVYDKQNKPHYGPPQALSAKFLKSLCELLKKNAKREIEILSNNILWITDEVVAWWSPAAVRPMFFKSATDNEANAMSGRIFPHPALMFVATADHLAVRALPTNERPNSDTPLFSAPYWNTYEDGSICAGSMLRPKSGTSASATKEWEFGFFGSCFTHPSGAVRLTSFKGGIVPLWQSVVDAEVFPDEHLVSAHESVLQFIRRRK